MAALAALLVSSVATLAVPFALRRMIDFGFSKESGGAVDAYFVAMAAVVIVIALAAATRYYLVTTLGERVVADLRRDVFAHLTGLDAAFYDRARTGELVSRLTADTTQIKAAFGASASIALRNLFMFVGATALMVYTSPKLSALVLDRHSGDRRAADRLGADRAQPVAPRPGHPRRCDRFRLREPRAASGRCRRSGRRR